MPGTPPDSASLAAFVAASPWPQRAVLGLLIGVASRPRGMALLRRLAPLDQLAGGLVTFGRYDEPRVSRSLGWDAAAVVARGRELRRREGRP